jgi:tryptophan synthase beta chain
MKSRFLQDENGQIVEGHSIAAGIDYPGVGPEHAFLGEIGRARYEKADDDEAIEAFRLLCETEGIIPALEPAHALAWLVRACREGEIERGTTVLLTLSGRGDKDVAQIMDRLQLDSLPGEVQNGGTSDE